MHTRRILAAFALLLCATAAGAAPAPRNGFALDATPPEPNSVQPRPADGAEAILNPPSLVWPADARVATYRIEFARTPAFDGDVIAADGIDMNFYNHFAELAEGEWYWRTLGATADGVRSAPGEVKSFVITDRSIPFPVPPTAELLAKMPDHPRLLTNPKELDAFRARAQGEAAGAWAEVKAEADALLKAGPPSMPELQPWPADPGKDRGQVAVAKGGKYWRPGKFSLGELNQSATKAKTLAYAYLISGDAKYGDAAAQWIDFIANFRIDPTLKDRAEHDTVVYCFEAGLKDFSLAYDHAYDRLTPETRARAVEAIEFQVEAAIEWVRDDVKIAQRYLNSHGQQCMHRTFTSVIAIAKDSPRADEWFDWLVRQYVNHIAWLGNDGGYFEGQTYGHKMRFIMEALVPLRSATGLDVFRQPHVANAGNFWLYGMSLNYWFDHWGDVYSLLQPGGSAADSHLGALLAAMSGNRYVRWWSETVRADEVEVPLQYLSETGLKPRPPADIAQARAFPDTGVVTAYDRFYDHASPRIFFRSSPWGSQSHSHSDQNMFVIHAGGEILAADVGYYTYYGDTYHTIFSRATPAHNTLLINGEGQPKSGEAPGRISAFFDSPEFVYFAGDASKAYSSALTRFDRRVLFIRPDTFIALDDVATTGPSKFQWLLNTFAKNEIDAAARVITVPQQNMRLRVQHLLPEKIDYTQNNDRPAPIQTKIWARVTEAFPQFWHLEAATKEAAEQGQFLALMNAYDEREGNPVAGAETLAADGATALTFERNGARYRVLFRNPEAGAITAGDVKAEAEMVVIESGEEAAPMAWMATEASRLAEGERQLLEAGNASGEFAVAYNLASAAALIRCRAANAGQVRVHVPKKPAALFTHSADARYENREVPVEWADGMLTLNLEAGREMVFVADPAVAPSALPRAASVAVTDADGAWKGDLETGIAEDGRWIAFGPLSPRREGIYRFTSDDPTAEFLVQDRWDMRRSTRGHGLIEGFWREGCEVYVHFAPSDPVPAIRAEFVRELAENERSILRNGGFEEGLAGYPPRDWTISHPRTGDLGWPEWVQTDAAEGESCVRFLRPKDRIILQAPPLKTLHAGKYLLRFKAKGEATCGAANVNDARGTAGHVKIEPSAEWRQWEVPVELARGFVTLTFTMSSGDPADQVLWLDDVELIPQS